MGGVSFESTVGRLVLVGVFAILLAVRQAFAWPAVTLVLLLTSLLPTHRKAILAVAAIGTIYFAPPLNLDHLHVLSQMHEASPYVPLWPLAAVIVLGFGYALTATARRWPDSVPGRHPVVTLLALLALLIAAGAHLPLHGAAWFAATATAMILSSYFWFFAYAASDAKLRSETSVAQHIAFWRPFWGFSNVPLGKGPAYLERVEARDVAQLVATQIGGLKLMISATAWFFVMEVGTWLFYTPRTHVEGWFAGLLFWLPPEGLPPPALLIERHVQGSPFPLATRWAAVALWFAMTVANMAAWGNTAIATCRMAGFNAAPNTDYALLSTSIAEFFNRYYYYFKELMAAFFFFPTFLRLAGTSPRLRLFTATLMAAGAGNFLFHFLRDSDEIFRLGFWNALAAYHVYAAYALLLGLGVAISQIRLLARHGRRPAGVRRVFATAGVLLFYCLLNVLDVGVSTHDISDYARFYVSLFVP